jgi:hypothetical protein
MRIDASNLLVAAQVQAQRPAAAKPPGAAAFEPLDFAKSPAAGRKQAPSPGTVPRPGMQLDIKV